VREAELAGHHPKPVLTAAVDARRGGLDGAGSVAGSVADVLRWRVRLQTRDRDPERRVDRVDWTTWTTWSASVPGPVGQFAHDLAVLATDRQAQIGQTAAVELPEWAISHFGGRPPAETDEPAWFGLRNAAAHDEDVAVAGGRPGPQHSGFATPTALRQISHDDLTAWLKARGVRATAALAASAGSRPTRRPPCC
jgi:hypothetical protein